MDKIITAFHDAFTDSAIGYAGNGVHAVRLANRQCVPIALNIIAKLQQDGELGDVQITTDLSNGMLYIETKED